MKKILINTLILIATISGFSQTIQLGSGITESSNYNSSPVNIWYRSTVCEFVYTASELNTAGASKISPLTQIGFYVTQSPIHNLSSYRIQMKHTAQVNVGSGLGNEEWTTIKNSFTYDPTAGDFDMIYLDNAFIWDGTSNIGIRICWDRASGYDASGKVRTYPTTNGFRYRSTDISDMCNSSPNTISNDKPQCQMVFIPGETTVWNGNVSTEWHNENNWSAGIPTKITNASIPASSGNQPIINSSAQTKNIDIATGATLSINGTEQIAVYGNWSNNGTFSSSGGKVIFDGDTTNLISCSEAQEFHDLQINNMNGATLSSGMNKIRGNLKLKGGKFTTNGLIHMASDITGTSMIGEIESHCSYTLTMNDSFGDGWNGGFITMIVNGLPTKTYAAVGSGNTITIDLAQGSTYQIQYKSGQYENENSYTLSDPDGNIVFSDGPTPGTGIVFTGTSACSFDDPISGELNIDRYVPGGATNWRFFSFPMQDAPLEQIDDDLITTGPIGSDYPGWIPSGWSEVFHTILEYDETMNDHQDEGYVPFESMSEIPQVGKGLRIFSGDALGGTSDFIIDWTGTANTGPIDLPVTFTPSGNSNADGWNLVGNPYHCTIDWDDPDWIKSSNIHDAIYFWDAEMNTYSSYINGVGTNGGSRYIAPGQSFFVKVAFASPTLQLQVNEQCKYELDVDFKSTSAGLVRLQIEKDDQIDETVLRLNSAATDNYDAHLDAFKVAASYWENTQISQLYFDREYSINSIAEITDHTVIPLIVRSSGAGEYKIKATDLSAIEPGMCITLEDLELGHSINLQNEDEYIFTLPDTVPEIRFKLHITPGTQSISEDASCFGYNDGSITALAFGHDTATYVWRDENGAVLKYSNKIGADTIGHLAAGIYTLTGSNIAGCPSFEDTIVIEQPEPINIELESTPENCANCCDGSISAMISGGNAPYDIDWLGSGNQDYIDDLCSGEYTVTIIDANNCEALEIGSVSMITSVDDLSANNELLIYPNPTNDILTVENLLGHIISIELHDSLGKIVHSEDGFNNSGSISLSIGHLPFGSYFLKINTEQGVTTKKIIKN